MPSTTAATTSAVAAAAAAAAAAAPKKKSARKKRPTPLSSSTDITQGEAKKPKGTKPATTAVASVAKRRVLPPRQPVHCLQEGGVNAVRITTTSTSSLTESFFPPTLYTNVQYTNPCNLRVDGERGLITIGNPTDYMQACYGGPRDYMTLYNPTLPPPSSVLWSQKFAATQAARHGNPGNALRRLGTITRTVQATTGPPKKKMDQHKYKSWNGAGPGVIVSPTITNSTTKQKRHKLTKTQAKKQALEDMEGMEFSSTNNFDIELQRRINALMELWNVKFWSEPAIPQFHDARSGDLSAAMLNDPLYYPLRTLLRKSWKWKDNSYSSLAVAAAAGGTEAHDLEEILKSLAELQCPTSLYKIPLLVAYPRVVKEKFATTKHNGSSTGTKHTSSYQVTIGVYAHRLLPEILVRDDLAIVMNSLDDGSYVVSQPLQAPPKPPTPTFESAKYPKVRLGVFDDDDSDDSDSDDDKEEDKDNKKQERKPNDKTLEGSTQTDANTISAFSTPGIMKLWENTGCDVRKWPQLHERLMEKDTKFEHELLLHQIHALCWMYDMEQGLGTFGINSILWEERKWLDGGTYYWSPALGQMRLDKPPTVHGGILADEMGLGKTIMVLALIAATYNREVKEPTLIIVPPALVGQWRNEINRAAPFLKVQVFHGPPLALDADIVVTTYQTVESRKYEGKALFDQAWGRIVLDEMQEIRSSTTAIAQSCDALQGNRRWMLSGTPLFEGITDLRGELNFLSLSPYCAKSEDGFFDFSIMDHWNHHSRHGLDILTVLGSLILRRSKSMTIRATGEDIMGLLPLKVEFVPVSQTPFERALYCFLEYIVGRELENTATKGEKRSETSRKLCLRLLRELCISPTLLTGGLGVASELMKLNNLLANHHRREREQAAQESPAEQITVQQPPESSATNTTMSCREAIRYLSYVQEQVTTATDFVSDMRLGAGGGVAKRNRATTSLEERLDGCRKELKLAKKAVDEAVSSRAKARWHWALEKITTGHFPIGAKSSTAAMWKWRYMVSAARGTSKKSFPPLLVRGWRPSKAFAGTELLAAHPHFSWAHPFALSLRNIPHQVESSELLLALNSITATCSSTGLQLIVPSCEQTAKPTWNTTIILNGVDAIKAVIHKAKRGIAVPTKAQIPYLKEALSSARKDYDDAKRDHDVFPTGESRDTLKMRSRKVEELKRGVLVVFGDNDGNDTHNIIMSRARNQPRSLAPSESETLYRELSHDIQDATLTLAAKMPTVELKSKLLRNLERASDIPEEILKMSAFESLEAMMHHEYQATSCVICMGVLGSSDLQCVSESDPGLVALTPCGHLFCKQCIENYISSVYDVKCPTCRKNISFSNLVTVDPSLSKDDHNKDSEQRVKAKSIIKKAAEMLEKSDGQLDPDLWLQLYLSIDPPKHVSRHGDSLLSAIPSEVIAFFRAATGMSEVHNKAAVLPDLEPRHGLSSKARALLNDLPRDEKCVVFTSSRSAVKHIACLLEYHSIGFRILFSRQKSDEAETAVQEWKDGRISNDKDGKDDDGNNDAAVDTGEEKKSETDISPNVLVVQAGAAASGLTLTAACKMFFLEPFVRQEEELQAYARCHRYGQTQPVHAKVYYTPVSVESRLLEWRRKTGSTAMAEQQHDTDVVYKADFMDSEDEEEKEEQDSESESEMDKDDAVDQENDENVDQTLFLLGLDNDEAPLNQKVKASSFK